MRITFFSNFLNHHQLPFCLEMYEKLGEDFKFIATEPIHAERLQMGYEDMSKKYPFSLNTYNDKKSYEKAVRLGTESDVVIIGSASDNFIRKRLKEDKLTFRYSERIFKKGRYRVLNPRLFISLVKKHTRYRSKQVYMLCASAYTAADFNLVGAYKNKAYKWGYFPEVKMHSLEILMKKKKHEVTKILWVGRLLNLKHPDHAVKVASMLKNKGYSFELNIIGSGEMEEYLRELIQKHDLMNCVKLLGSMTPEQVRKYMEGSNIYLFTSDYNEGWGAVLNEAMNSGCAVVASHAVGSVPFLMRNRENGLIYKSGDLNELFKCTQILLEDRELCNELGREACKTLNETWNAKEAAKRFISLSESILKDKRIEFEEGPCSKAEVISQKYDY
ncbi:glycosyltransferase family 4 protein [Bacillus thermotolerans]|uniref:Glycosyl transferase n=1 Tax=Bacillus thermotolerans TaxID=1221996 RepID=A0A0F5I5G9_BACTR|nr:glycosyltransferase [Bacillus thermotolerans]KKB40904.1 glycosyl transferase [Bacillus thermotolerans]